ncbi:hypothetical protein HPP92_015811 [Vanilla planifolia]|uniref:MBD domain-containing protein n=1 Tax=Vanilla planifolia TaxID=51239 RepID=A0A835QQ62_VANPL|nr:hypothetical protein HPP92_015811 [Vanilla planifolia]
MIRRIYCKMKTGFGPLINPTLLNRLPGWDRQLRIRGEGSTRFADVYYVAPSGKRLRSMVELKRYLEEHPEYSRQRCEGITVLLSDPGASSWNYVGSRTGRPLYSGDKDGSALRRHSEPIEGGRIETLAFVDCSPASLFNITISAELIESGWVYGIITMEVLAPLQGLLVVGLRLLVCDEMMPLDSWKPVIIKDDPGVKEPTQGMVYIKRQINHKKSENLS